MGKRGSEAQIPRVAADNAPSVSPVFVDVFAGCGGLSLGLMEAGWRGLFAIEKDSFAFDTLATNLLQQEATRAFDWPSWLPREPLCVTKAMTKYKAQLSALSRQVDLLVGGPPCQGFSSAGRRDPKDPRNQLFASYLKLVDTLQPKLVLLENVRGITADFCDEELPRGKVNYAAKLITALSKRYTVSSQILDLSSFGVPQNRSRFFLIGVRKDLLPEGKPVVDPFATIEAERYGFLRSKGLAGTVSSKAAISDLEVDRNGTIPSPDSVGFRSITYKGPRTPYQRLMHNDASEQLSDTRLANHRPEIADRFQKIINACHETGRLNISLSREARESYGLKKQAIRVLDPDRPSPTITSMPDDLLHYREPRTLTVRENARLQSFPDWFVFKGKYTTGGHLRRLQVPRFTQVANAVPPLAAEAIGRSLLRYLEQHLPAEAAFTTQEQTVA
ncbi:MAG: DNA cytosine methyltransferase [Bacteroidetes bacterium]|nr:DNA cytosine methyltransferase [Bacteroidota bacterium]